MVQNASEFLKNGQVEQCVGRKIAANFLLLRLDFR